MNEITKPEKKSLINTMAAKYDMEPKSFEATVRSTAMPAQHTNEQFAAFLMVANQYNLNPVIGQIYAFPSKGGIKPIVSIDGFLQLANSNPNFDGMEFVDDTDDKGNLLSITCKMYRKDRAHPVEVTEYMNECKRDTQPWKQWPARMLRHKAAIQAARYAFSFAGIYDPDEGERIAESENMQEVYEIAYTEAEQKEFNLLFSGDDALAFWLFWNSLNQYAQIDLFNSFPKKKRGSAVPGKTENKERVRQLEAEGVDIFTALVDQLNQHIDNNDTAGVVEIKTELRTAGWDKAFDLLTAEQQKACEELMGAI